MQNVNLQNLTDPLSNALKLKICDSFISKFLGLMGKPNIGDGEGLLFINKTESVIDSSIHMFFMKFDIAVVWMDKDYRVIDKVIAKRWHPYYAPKKPAKCFIETNAHRYEDFHINDILEIKYA